MLSIQFDIKQVIFGMPGNKVGLFWKARER